MITNVYSGVTTAVVYAQPVERDKVVQEYIKAGWTLYAEHSPIDRNNNCCLRFSRQCSDDELANKLLFELCAALEHQVREETLYYYDGNPKTLEDIMPANVLTWWKEQNANSD